jgi:hypothetical protein
VLAVLRLLSELADERTQQEPQIAQLAAARLSNAEIGARLIISQHGRPSATRGPQQARNHLTQSAQQDAARRGPTLTE